MPPRPIRPRNDIKSFESNEGSSDSKGGRRKPVSSACIPCRKRKSKCDGQLPACSTCIAVYRTECSYDVDSDHRRKAALKRDIQTLQQQNDALDVIVASLRSLPENESIALLQNLRNDTDPDVLAASLRSNVRLPHNYGAQTLEADFAQQSTTPTNTATTLSPSLPRTNSSDSQPYTDSTVNTVAERPSDWFTVPQDPEFIEHLLNLYRSWVYPFYSFVVWDHFIHDMGHGRTEFCSALLVNAILAFACHYSDRPMARIDPSDPVTAGEYFFSRAKHLLEDMSAKPSLPAVQALGVMSLRETSAGRDSNGYQLAGRCVRMAIEMGLHLSVIGSCMSAEEAHVRKVTFWAVFNLETICAVSFGRLSQLPHCAADIEKPSTIGTSDDSTWYPYQDVNVSISPSAEQPARHAHFEDSLSKLSELASDMVNTFYAPRERFTSRRLAATYAQYRTWYQNLPDAFRLENTSLPHVLVLHMYYYGCVLHLFRPYIKLDLSGANLYPRDTCTFCANQISNLMNALRALYGLRRVCLAVTSLLLSASTIHLLNLPSTTAAAHLSQGLHDMEAMSVNHRFAARAVDIIRALSSKWNISLPESAASVAIYRLQAQRDLSPPTSSAFFAASIPEKRSPVGPSASYDSPEQDSRFGLSGLPNQQNRCKPQTRAPTSVPTFYSDPTTQLEPHQANSAFWMPFPSQVMPMPQGLGSASLDPAELEEAAASWNVFGPSIGGAHQQQQQQASQPHIPRHDSAPGRLDESMGGMAEWDWR